MSTGLEEEEGALQTAMGLPGKKKQGSTQQADQFKSAFQGKMSGVNGDLQYTAAHAEAKKHAEHDGKRAKLVSAFQSALAKIDPTNASVAQSAISKVLDAAGSLSASVSDFRKTAEKAFQGWTDKQSVFDAISEKVAEMNEWGYAKGSAIAEIADKIAAAANEKKYDESTQALTGLEGKFGPIEQDFDAQVAAQQEYESALPGAEAALEPTRTCEFASLAERQEQLLAAEEAMHQSVEQKDYVSAVEQLSSVKAEAEAVSQEADLLAQARDEVEAAKAELDPKLQEASTSRFPETAELDQRIAAQTEQMEQQIEAEAFGEALTVITELGAKVDEKLELEEKLAAKEAYDQSAATEQPHIDAADGTDPDDHYKLKQAQEAYIKADKAHKAAVKAENWEEALAKLTEAATLAKEYVELRKAYDTYKSEIAKVQSDMDYVEELRDNSPATGGFAAETTLYTQMINNYNQGKFTEAVAQMKTLAGKVADLKTRVTAADAEAQPKADAATKEIKDLAGGKDLTTLTTAEQDALVEELKKLTPDKQRQLLEDMHGPSAKLTAEQREMQIAMYKAMTLDEDFKKEDAKIREQYQTELQNDEELKSAIQDWKKTDAEGNPLVDFEKKKQMFQKILETQSKAYGIDVPEIEWYPGDEGDFGGFSADTTRISLNTRYLDNPKEMMDTIIHENTHNYQDELVKKFVAGDLKEGDPMYEQAKTFAVTHHWDAYVPPREDGDAYEKQPEEMQAWDAGGTESTKLMEAFKETD